MFYSQFICRTETNYIRSAISDIREFMEKEANRGLFSRMIHNASISARVAGFDAQLADSMATFMVTT